MAADGLSGVGGDARFIDPQTSSGHGNGDRASGFGQAVGRCQGVRVEAEARHFGCEPLCAFAVDGLAAVECEARRSEVHIGHAA